MATPKTNQMSPVKALKIRTCRKRFQKPQSSLQGQMKREKELRTRSMEDRREEGASQTSPPNHSAGGAESISL